jgi:ABC-2 type transport system ATP-binding protein
MLHIENLSKTYRSNWLLRSTQAVKNLSLDVYRGESFGFLGHNGAGKTTTIKCIMGLIHMTSGRITVDGKRLGRSEQYKTIGYLPEHPYFYDHLTVYETLDFFACLHEIKEPERAKRISETLELAGLGDRAKSPVKALSKGLEQRLGFAQAIINRPKFLLLDEPFSGLDPLGRAETRNLVLDLKKQGTTIFLSSHILSDVEDICDRVGIMARGNLKRVFSLEEIPRLFGQSFQLGIKAESGLKALPPSLSDNAVSRKQRETLSGTVFLLEFSDYDRAAKCMNDALAQGLKIESFKSSGPNLEEIFVSITVESRQDPGRRKGS